MVGLEISRGSAQSQQSSDSVKKVRVYVGYEHTNKFSQSDKGYEFSRYTLAPGGRCSLGLPSGHSYPYYRLLMSDVTTPHYEAESDPE